MIPLLADEDTQGHVARLAARMQREPFVEFWNDLGISLVVFADVGLNPADTGAAVWARCQERGLFLITGNRNDDGPDSLESTIRARNTAASLPVFIRVSLVDPIPEPALGLGFVLAASSDCPPPMHTIVSFSFDAARKEGSTAQAWNLTPRVMPSFFMRLRSVLGCRSRIRAAPRDPSMTQLV